MAKKDNGIVNIHGKEYQTVALRVTNFRKEYPSYTLETSLIDRDEKTVVMKASISDDTGRLIATGFAEENRGFGNINKTSALENCETSAIGRALAAFGFCGTEYATANEVNNAITQQNTIKAEVNRLRAEYNSAQNQKDLEEIWKREKSAYEKLPVSDQKTLNQLVNSLNGQWERVA